MQNRTSALDLYEKQLRFWADALPKDSRIDFGLTVDRLMMAIDHEIDAVRGAAGAWSRTAEHVYAAKKAAKIE